MVRGAFRFVLLALICYGGIRSYYFLTDDFRIGNIVLDREYSSEWEASTHMSPATREILSQDFAYLNKGAQSYAFQSEDGRYILKLFKFKHVKPSWLVKMLPDIELIKPFKERYFTRKNEKLQRMFRGYLLAFQKHREESGILYLHLNRTTHLDQRVTLYDKLGISHAIDLDTMAFVLQRRAIRTDEILQRLLSKGEVTAAKCYIKQILALYRSEYQKGIHDTDVGALRNTGIVGETPIRFDVGELTVNKGLTQKGAQIKDLQRIAIDLQEWLLTHYPDSYSELSNEITQFIKSIEGAEASAT